MVCAARGYPFVATMAESFSVERRKIMRALGAKVILTPAAERGTGMVKKAEELAEKHGWFLARQFENPANPAYHRQTTGPEILEDFAGRRLDFWVTGWGTGGTLTGRRRGRSSARGPTSRSSPAEPAGAVAARRQGVEAAQDPGLDAGLRARRARTARVVRRARARSPTRKARTRRGAGAGGRHLRRHLRRARRSRPRLKVAGARRRAACCSRMLPDTGERYLARSCSRASTRAPTTTGSPRCSAQTSL